MWKLNTTLGKSGHSILDQILYQYPLWKMLKDLQSLATTLWTFLRNALSWAAWAMDESIWTILHWIVLTIELCLWKALRYLAANLWNGSAVQCIIFLYHLSPVAWILLPEILLGASSFTCMGLQRLIQVGMFFGWLVFLSTLSLWFQLLIQCISKMFLLWLKLPWKIISGSFHYMKRLSIQSLKCFTFL